MSSKTHEALSEGQADKEPFAHVLVYLMFAIMIGVPLTVLLLNPKLIQQVLNAFAGVR